MIYKKISKILNDLALFLSQDEIDMLKKNMLDIPFTQFYDEGWEYAKPYIYKAMFDSFTEEREKCYEKC